MNRQIPSPAEVEQAIAVLNAAGYLRPMWTKDDIMVCMVNEGYQPTEELVDKVADAIERRHDAEIGINWEVINAHIDIVMHP